MSFAKLGFLSPEVDGYRAEQRERHRAAFDATEALMRRTIDVATAPSSVGSTATPAYLLGVGFWLRSFEACQATILLTERGLQTSAFAMLRTAFECLFYASALWRNPNLFPRLQANHDGERIKQAKGMLREGAAGRVRGGRGHRQQRDLHPVAGAAAGELARARFSHRQRRASG